MTLEQLAAFVAVAEREHLTMAATAIGLSPSSVSAAIKKLEQQYGVELFDRCGRGISLTKAGKIFLGEAKATLASVKQAEGILAKAKQINRGVE